MATRVQIQSAKILMQPSPNLIMLYMKLIKIGKLTQEIYYFKSVDGQTIGARTSLPY